MLPLMNQTQIMAYYLLTVLEQDDGVEVQRLVKDLVRSRVRVVELAVFTWSTVPYSKRYGRAIPVWIFVPNEPARWRVRLAAKPFNEL